MKIIKTADLKILYNHSRFENSYSDLRILLNQNFDFILKFTESMYREDFDAYFEFLLTNRDYKNRLGRFSWTLDDLAPRLGYKKYEAITLYNQMIILGFPNDGREILKSMYQNVAPKIAKPFIGSYTNTIDTLRIYFKDKDLVGYNSKYNSTVNLMIKDSVTLNNSGAYLEFSSDKSEFYFLMEAKKPFYKRLHEND